MRQGCVCELWHLQRCGGACMRHSSAGSCHFLVSPSAVLKGKRSPSLLRDAVSFLNLLICNKPESASVLPSQWHQHWQDIQSRLEMAPMTSASLPYRTDGFCILCNFRSLFMVWVSIIQEAKKLPRKIDLEPVQRLEIILLISCLHSHFLEGHQGSPIHANTWVTAACVVLKI